MFRLPMFFYDQNTGAGGGSDGNSDSTDYKALYEALKSQVDGGTYIEMARYTGLQGTLAKEQNKRSVLESDLASTRENLKTVDQARANFEQQLSAVTEQLNTLTAFKTEAERTIAEKDAKIVRLDLIVTKFPHLAAFEAKGILPAAPTDQLESKFDAFSKEISVLQQNSAQKLLDGTKPPASNGGGNTGNQPNNEAVILVKEQEARQAAKFGKVADYDRLQKEIAELKKADQRT